MFKFICLIASVSCIDLAREVPHDYGNPGAISEQHQETMGVANKWEATRKAVINQ